MYIRRDKSNLHFGQQTRRGSRSLLIIWLATMAVVVAVIWRFNSVQSWVLASIDGASTATLDAVSLAKLGERAYLNGDLEESIRYYSEAARLAPNDIDIKYEYGRVLIYRSYAGRNYYDRAVKALEVAEDAVRIDENNPRAQTLLCIALLENNRPEEAIGAGVRAIDLAPNYAEAYAYLAMSYYRAERPNQAFEAANKAVELNPNSVDARRALALSLSFIGEYDAAIQQYEQAIQIHPRLDALYFELARYYVVKQNYDAAIKAYDQVLAMESDNVKAYTRKCETYFTMRNDQMAQEACEQAIELDPAYPEAWRQLGMVQYARRNFEGAIESLTTCANLQEAAGVPLQDREIQCYYIRGLAHVLLANCDDGWEVLQEALAMNPAEQIKGAINQGLQMCVEYSDEFNPSDIPTPAPTPTVPREPIGVF